MDGRKRRTQTRLESIRHAALALFAAHGAEKVSMDDIAAKANVSKVTIYKHFPGKEALYAEAVRMYIDETLAETEAVFNSEIDFLEKLKFALLKPADTSPLVNWSYLMQVWDRDGQLAASLQNKVKSLMLKLIDEGKRTGFIDENLPFEVVYLYSEIFRAGFGAVVMNREAAWMDKDTAEKLVNLYFFGILKRQ